MLGKALVLDPRSRTGASDLAGPLANRIQHLLDEAGRGLSEGLDGQGGAQRDKAVGSDPACHGQRTGDEVARGDGYGAGVMGA